MDKSANGVKVRDECLSSVINKLSFVFACRSTLAVQIFFFYIFFFCPVIEVQPTRLGECGKKLIEC